MELYTAFLIGLVGSLHCIGMCGPIAVMLPGDQTGIKFIFGRLLYNSGRVLTYMLMGVIIGFIGNKIMLYGFQQTLSIVLGILILIVVLVPRKLILKPGIYSYYNKLFPDIKNKMGVLFRRKSYYSLFTIGVLNGFLPCGLVYLALGGAAASGSALSGMEVMMLFGLGTMPVMLAVSSIYKIIPVNFRIKASKLVPYFAVLLAVIFILRGLNLGIPFISPKMDKMAIQNSGCTH